MSDTHNGVMTATEKSREAPPTTQRTRARSMVATILVACGAGGVTALATAPHPDCQTVRAVITHISDHRDLIASTRLKASPPLPEYQDWAATLKHLAAAASSPDITPRLEHIADRAEHAAGLVALAKSNPASDGMPSQMGITGGFAQNVEDIVAAEHELIDICHFG